MDLDAITSLIITYNEEPNLPRVLAALGWCKHIVAIDSFSSDGTLDILRSHRNVRVLQRQFDSFASQCNFGLAHVETEWVLSLDADYVCSPEMTRELEDLPESATVEGYRARFKYCIDGKPLRASLYPPRTVLYRRLSARYEDDGHSHHVRVAGSVGDLRSYIYHDDRKSLDSWLAAQQRYALKEVEKLRSTPRELLSRPDKVRRVGWIAPLLMPFYCLLVRGLVLDGRAGLYYTMQRTFAEVLLALRIGAAGVRSPGTKQAYSAPPVQREQG